ncbi:hypothetical protein [Peribacillus sp. FSL E2-0218]|uniref:hypothetical protein n=1 Tax=Peribacillus sp. FSL E2-0218 TaxID=2921364 RepID=UPI0030EB5C01
MEAKIQRLLADLESMNREVRYEDYTKFVTARHTLQSIWRAAWLIPGQLDMLILLFAFALILYPISLDQGRAHSVRKP